VFRKGDVAAGQGLVLDTPLAQIVPVSSWDDGSVKLAVVAGRADFVANTGRTFTVSKGTAASAAALTEADLIAANPTAAVSYGSYGTVELAALLGTSARVLTEQAGPQYAVFQYIANFPSDSVLRAVFYVQLWAGGRYRVRIGVENGIAPATSGSKSGTATVTIGGVQRFSAAVSMPQGTRWDVVGFGGSEPQITPSFDVAYLVATKLVPNYGWKSPSSTTLNDLATNYAPMARLGWEQDMSGTGYAPSIGLLPHWDALFCTTGDARAYNASLAHARAYGTYSIFYRDPATKRFPRFADYPTYYLGEERMTGSGSNTNTWEFAHHPNAGYLPWLLTAERFFLEVVEANSWAAYATNSNNNGGGVNRLYVSQTRGRAWRYRTMAALAAIAPDNDLLGADRRGNVVANLNNWQAIHVVPNKPATGLIGILDDKDPSVNGFQHSIFESLFLVSSIGWSWDQDLRLTSTQKETLRSVRDFAYRLPAGLTGRGPAQGEFSWRRAPGPYRMLIGPTPSSPTDTATLYNTFNEIYQATYGDQLNSADGLTMLEAYVDDPSPYAFPQGNWGHVLTALAFAVDHSAPNAAAGYARLTSASNWSSNTVKFNDWPQYGVKPR
jgi:hypothetical protein